MWLFTTLGFYSVVAHRGGRDRLLVRARTEADIEAPWSQIPSLKPFEDPAADYRWRAIVSRSEWSDAVQGLVGELDHPNFKGAVAARQSLERAALYEEVWWKLRLLQESARGPTRAD